MLAAASRFFGFQGRENKASEEEPRPILLQTGPPSSAPNPESETPLETADLANTGPKICTKHQDIHVFEAKSPGLPLLQSSLQSAQHFKG